ncbi:MAG: ATP-binding protein [Planctomycetes bacterium]|nr:ATP-binding protein [Planctomycetota bacterium]
MYPRLLKPPTTSFFLFGPRGTGKTTWIREHFSIAKTFDLLDERLYQKFLADAALFARELLPLRRGSWVVIDEIQRLPSLLNEVHRAIENQGLRFALTGSSARKLRRGGVNLLSGRAVRRLMFPFTPEELGDDFRLDRALSIGTLPVVWTHDDPADALEAYVQMYLREEIQAEALVRNLPGFARFLPVAALFHGQQLNVSTLARDAGVSRTTVNGYVEILEDTLVANRLHAFEGKLRVREKRHPKLYWIDPGLVRTLKHHRGPVSHEEKGPLLEGFVFMLLRAVEPRARAWDEIYYWSPGEAKLTEVDFLVVRGTEKMAIEVKSATRPKEEHFRGLRAIGDLKGLKRRLLVYLGDAVLRTEDGIDAWPFETFAEKLANGKL